MEYGEGVFKLFEFLSVALAEVLLQKLVGDRYGVFEPYAAFRRGSVGADYRARPRFLLGDCGGQSRNGDGRDGLRTGGLGEGRLDAVFILVVKMQSASDKTNIAPNEPHTVKMSVSKGMFLSELKILLKKSDICINYIRPFNAKGRIFWLKIN